MMRAHDFGAHAYSLLLSLEHTAVCVHYVYAPKRECIHAETALSRVTADGLLTNFQINALGPVLVSKAGLRTALFWVMDALPGCMKDGRPHTAMLCMSSWLVQYMTYKLIYVGICSIAG